MMYIPNIIPEADRGALVDKGNFGGTIGIEGDVAILNVDMTKEFVESGYAVGHPETGKPAAHAIRRLMDVANEQGIRGYYSRSIKGDHPCKTGRWGDVSQFNQTEEAVQITEILQPTQDDVVFEKYKPSIFFGTQLVGMLNFDNIDTVIVTGMTTSGCVRATVVDAFSHNFRVIIPEECVADRSNISHEVTLFDMDMKYADVMQLDDVIESLQN
jgi:nicotinamidase-related amidase